METGDGSRVSLRRRLLARKSPRVACSMDAGVSHSSHSPSGGRTPPDHLFSARRSSLDRACLSDSEAQNHSTALNPPVAPTSPPVSRTPRLRPTSMIEGHSAMDAERSRRSPLNKYVTALKGQHSIVKARSDPDCDQSHSDNEANSTMHKAYLNGNGKLISNNRMSSSMSAMQRSDEFGNKSDISYKSSLESVENTSLRNSDSNIDKDFKSSTPRSGSTDSLARHTLLAAKVLRLIPTQKARERNYLHGRLASNSLLGAAELDRVFPNREVEIFVGTWNMNGHNPPSELNDFLFPNGIKNVPDILAIGIQEAMPEKTEWEICIQEALGPSHILFHSTSLGTLHLCIFIRRDLIWFCSLPEDSSISVRPGTAFRTKGAIAIAFALFGTTFLFITAHLTAHQEKVKERVHDIKKIIRALDLPKTLPLKHKKNKDVTCNFDVVIWCGDLNFRLTEEREVIMRGLADSLNDRTSNDSKISKISSTILQADQLSAVMSSETTLKGFQEAPICFRPTYKYDPGTQTFDTSSKQRVPAYTDRILYKMRTAAPASGSLSGLRRNSSAVSSEPVSVVHCLAYDSVPTICSSDHKPVWALFTATLRPGTDIIPLAAGLFNREVYLEGIKRRAALLDHPPGTSAICSIQ